MKRLATILNIFAFTVLFCEYAVAMEPPQPAGTRRFLQIYAGQLPTGSFPTIKPVWPFSVAIVECDCRMPKPQLSSMASISLGV